MSDVAQEVLIALVFGIIMGLALFMGGSFIIGWLCEDERE